MVTDLFREELISLIPRMRRFARGLAGDADRADDLVQDAIERAWMHRDRWREGTRLDSWLYRIIRNRWIDAWRAAKARGEDMDAEAAAALPGVDGREALEAEARKLEIARAMAALSAEHRETVALVLIEGFNYREAADLMGVSEGTVASRLSRAKAVLIERLREDEEDENEERRAP